ARVWRAGSGVPPEPSEPLSAGRREQHARRARSPDPFAAKPQPFDEFTVHDKLRVGPTANELIHAVTRAVRNAFLNSDSPAAG
ncbi:MAG: hypothetical protein ABIZ81_03870, partial [Opitutaceae bacterium]